MSIHQTAASVAAPPTTVVRDWQAIGSTSTGTAPVKKIFHDHYSLASLHLENAREQLHNLLKVAAHLWGRVGRHLQLPAKVVGSTREQLAGRIAIAISQLETRPQVWSKPQCYEGASQSLEQFTFQRMCSQLYFDAQEPILRELEVVLGQAVPSPDHLIVRIIRCTLDLITWHRLLLKREVESVVAYGRSLSKLGQSESVAASASFATVGATVGVRRGSSKAVSLASAAYTAKSSSGNMSIGTVVYATVGLSSTIYQGFGGPSSTVHITSTELNDLQGARLRFERGVRFLESLKGVLPEKMKSFDFSLGGEITSRDRNNWDMAVKGVSRGIDCNLGIVQCTLVPHKNSSSGSITWYVGMLGYLKQNPHHTFVVLFADPENQSCMEGFMAGLHLAWLNRLEPGQRSLLYDSGQALQIHKQLDPPAIASLWLAWISTDRSMAEALLGLVVPRLSRLRGDLQKIANTVGGLNTPAWLNLTRQFAQSGQPQGHELRALILYSYTLKWLLEKIDRAAMAKVWDGTHELLEGLTQRFESQLLAKSPLALCLKVGKGVDVSSESSSVSISFLGIKLQLIRSDLLVNKSALPEAIGNTRTYSLSWSPISFALGLEGFGGEFGSGFASRLRQAGLPESCITVLQEIWPKEFFAANSLQLVFTLRLENGQMRLALIQLFASAHRKLTTAPLSGQVALGVERNRRKVVAQMLGTESLWALFSIVWGLLSDRRVGLAEFRHGRGQFSGLFYKSLTHGVCTKLAQAEGRKPSF